MCELPQSDLAQISHVHLAIQATRTHHSHKQNPRVKFTATEGSYCQFLAHNPSLGFRPPSGRKIHIFLQEYRYLHQGRRIPSSRNCMLIWWSPGICNGMLIWWSPGICNGMLIWWLPGICNCMLTETFHGVNDFWLCRRVNDMIFLSGCS